MARLLKLESATEQRAHQSVFLYADRADAPRLLSEAVLAGRISKGYGVIVLPMPLLANEWERDARAHFMRLDNS